MKTSAATYWYANKATLVAILHFKLTLRMLANLSKNNINHDAIQPQRFRPVELDAKNAGQPVETGKKVAKDMRRALQRSS